ncbi:MAG: hypothetical protein JWQ21_1756 [Herminiimonas sp.]|nr:hypothetical protein [Herminiimonas sp.]
MKYLNVSAKKSRIVTALLLSSALASAWAHSPGRMTGGGSIYCPAPVYRVTFGYELHCRPDGGQLAGPNNLEVNFSSGDHFHLASLTQSSCIGSATTRPDAPFDTLVGAGEGTFNGQPATISFTLVDNAEPGTGQDTAQFTISTTGGPVLSCGPLSLEGGNNQAHTATGSKQ